MSKSWIANVRFELTQIEKLLPLAAEIVQTVEESGANYLLTAASGKILHDFYHGAEHILIMIAKAIDGEIPTGQAWHVALLRQMMVETEERSAVITSELAFDLREYLSFRHFFRHAYGYNLDWERMGHLVTQLPAIQAQFAAAIDQFLANYE